jgi:alanine-glyoxylate transaminase / serine-glyoxylate transaminase / serine-pyruvate transaminase
MDRPTIDHRSLEAAALFRSCHAGIQAVFRTDGPVIIYPSSGTGAWEAALVNTLDPEDRVLAFETGQFSALWAKMASNLGLRVDVIPGDWRSGVDAGAIAARLAEDPQHEIKAVTVVHNETSTGVTSNVAKVRQAIDHARHPALLMVDTISSLASIDYRHDAWGVDVSVGASQKGLMLPPGLSFNAISPKALSASHTSRFQKSYWRWSDILENNEKGFFPYTPATNLLYGLREALRMLEEEGLPNVFRRHQRLAEAARRAVSAWDLEILAQNPEEYSSTATAVLLPGPHSESAFRALVLERFNLALGAGLGKVAGKVFRIGHLGDFNDLMLAATLAGIEMGLSLAGVPHRRGGVASALDYLTEQSQATTATG